jgi:hypothetical protein
LGAGVMGRLAISLVLVTVTSMLGLYIICPNETREFDVFTNETQGALKDHVRGIYLDSFYKSKSEGTTLCVEFTKS